MRQLVIWCRNAARAQSRQHPEVLKIDLSVFITHLIRVGAWIIRVSVMRLGRLRWSTCNLVAVFTQHMCWIVQCPIIVPERRTTRTTCFWASWNHEFENALIACIQIYILSTYTESWNFVSNLSNGLNFLAQIWYSLEHSVPRARTFMQIVGWKSVPRRQVLPYKTVT